MTLELYDEAVERKLKKLFDNVIGAPSNEALWSSNKNGKVSLPLISFYRTSNPIDWTNYNNAELFGTKGYRRTYNDETGESTNTLSIAVNISYQIDLWAADRKTVDSLFHDIVFALILHPDIELDMDGTEDNKIFSLRLVDSQNSTDVASFLQTNRIYRYSLTYTINEARLMYQEKSTYITREIPVKTSVDDDSNSTLGKNVPVAPGLSPGISPGVRIVAKDTNDQSSDVYDPENSTHGDDGSLDIYPNKIDDNTSYNDDTKPGTNKT